MSNWIESKWNEVTSGANTAPTPQVSTSPPAGPLAKTWNAPNVSHPGHLQVNTSHLASAADVIKTRLPDLDEAVNAVTQQLDAFGSLSGWQAGEQMKAQLTALVQQCAALGKEQSNVNAKAALDLTRSAEAYQNNEDATKKAIGGLGSAITAGTTAKVTTQSQAGSNAEGWV